jgi:hypothetical protein
VDRCGNSFHFGIFSTVISARHNNVAVELATDFNTIFLDSGFGANLNAAVFNNFNQINRNNFFESPNISLFPV